MESRTSIIRLRRGSKRALIDKQARIPHNYIGYLIHSMPSRNCNNVAWVVRAGLAVPAQQLFYTILETVRSMSIGLAMYYDTVYDTNPSILLVSIF